MKISGKELIEDIRSTITTLLSDEIIRNDYISSNDEIDTTGTKQWPRVYIRWTDDGSLDINTNTAVLGFLFLDVSTSKTNKSKKDYEIKSDMVQAASKLFDNLIREDYFGEATPTLGYTPVSNAYDNGLSGIMMTVTFNLAKPCYNV